MDEQTVICPNCGKKFAVSKVLSHQIETELRKDFDAQAKKWEREAKDNYANKLAEEISRMEVKARKEAKAAASGEVAKMKTDLAQVRKSAKAAKDQFESRIAAEKARIERNASKKAKEEVGNQLTALQRQLNQKNKKIAQVKSASIKIEEETTERLENDFHLKELEWRKKIGDAKRQATELKRRLDQSSQQTQGEVVELELHDLLKQAFPEDQIEPFATGKRGADVLQKVYSSTGHLCGTIIWEAKNTRKWSKSWLTKLRADQRRAKAEMAVLVSVVLPNEIKHFSQMDGVWVTQLPLALSLGIALRSNLIEVSAIRQTSEGKHGKMELLFEYLSSIEFRHRIEAIVEAFRTMQDDLGKERQAMERYWAKRDKQMQLVLQNVSGMYGDMQGIAGQSLPKIRRLELPPATTNSKPPVKH